MGTATILVTLPGPFKQTFFPQPNSHHMKFEIN